MVCVGLRCLFSVVSLLVVLFSVVGKLLFRGLSDAFLLGRFISVMRFVMDLKF